MESSKVYVDVLAKFTKEGMLMPKHFTWEDGHEYDIDRVKDIRRVASTRAGGVGMRYTCLVEGKEVYLYLEEDKWFMERKTCA